MAGNKYNFFTESESETIINLYEKLLKLQARLEDLGISESNDLMLIKELNKKLNKELIEIRNKIIANYPDVNIDFLDKCIYYIESSNQILQKNNNNNKELENIKRGLYQHQLYLFTDQSLSILDSSAYRELVAGQNNKQYQDCTGYKLFPLMNQWGLRCTAAIPKQVSSGPIEIQINFFGTIDFSSLVADLERGGPGQKTLKKHEGKLLKQINDLLMLMSNTYPNKTFRLRLAGHSLGGALAKGFAHSMQRACAVQESEAEAVILKIKKEINEETQIKNIVSPELYQNLEKKLKVDKNKFKGLNALSKIEGITVYALGAPGVSKTIDRHASLLTYYHQPNFLNMYNHYHQEDIIPKFGNTEFFSGKNGIVPRVTVNKVIRYDVDISKKEEEMCKSLPFPHITRRVMAAHNKLIYNNEQPIQSTVIELAESKDLSEKFTFSVFRRALYEAAFFFLKFIASFETMVKLIPYLSSFPETNIKISDLQELEDPRAREAMLSQLSCPSSIRETPILIKKHK